MALLVSTRTLGKRKPLLDDFSVPPPADAEGGDELRLFLPFADDDPKTAEVLAKTLLLARDDQIKDPSILSQIRN